MTDVVVHPGLVLIAGGLALTGLRGRARSVVLLLLPLVSLALLWLLPDGVSSRFQFLDYVLTPLSVDSLARLFATIFSVMALGGGWFALRQTSRLEVPAAFVYAGAAIGVVLAGDLLTLVVFWELMAVGSTLVLWSSGTSASYQASLRYLMLHVLGGVVLLAGVTGHVAATGDVTFTALALDSPAQWLILAGFLLNAGAPPLSAWLADAYPEASWSGMVFLSAFTTKTAVYVLMRGFPGAEILVYVGLFMVFYGIVYALLENDMRRILAYSIVNQVGFMITGIGIGTAMALNGAAAHAFTHIIYKALLLMSAGSVLYVTGRRKCTDLGGLFHSMPVTTICGIIGALAISSFPLTSGFISKSMISQSALDGNLQAVWLLLGAASAGVFLHAGIKFPWFVFFQKDSGLRPPDPPASMRWAMIALAVLCVGLGVWPEPLYRMLPYPVTYVPYTGAHVVTQVQLLLFSGLAFFVMLPYLKRTLTMTLDVDLLYRAVLPGMARRGGRTFSSVSRRLAGIVRSAGTNLQALVQRIYGPDGSLARTWATGTMALWTLVLLLGYLLLFYL